jgi:hypothetical protein
LFPCRFTLSRQYCAVPPPAFVRLRAITCRGLALAPHAPQLSATQTACTRSLPCASTCQHPHQRRATPLASACCSSRARPLRRYRALALSRAAAACASARRPPGTRCCSLGPQSSAREPRACASPPLASARRSRRAAAEPLRARRHRACGRPCARPRCAHPGPLCLRLRAAPGPACAAQGPCSPGRRRTEERREGEAPEGAPPVGRKERKASGNG